MTNKKNKENNKQLTTNTKFGQDKLRHAKRGVSSCLFAVIGLVTLIGPLVSAYTSYGQSSIIIGSFACISMFLSITGILQGFRGFRERNKNYNTCKLGILINGILITLFILFYIRGLS